jgi:hypothetical protein
MGLLALLAGWDYMPHLRTSGRLRQSSYPRIGYKRLSALAVCLKLALPSHRILCKIRSLEEYLHRIDYISLYLPLLYCNIG